MVSILLIAIWTGWIRVGLNLPFTHGMANHGAIFVLSFTLSLVFFYFVYESRKKKYYLIPIFNMLSVVPLLLNLNKFAFLLLTLIAIWFFLFLFSETNSFSNVRKIILLSSTLMMIVGNFKLFMTGFYPIAIPFWTGAFILILLSAFTTDTNFTGYRKMVSLLLCLLFILTAFIPFHANGEYFLGCLLISCSFVIPFIVLKIKSPFKTVYILGIILSHLFLLITGLIYIIGTIMVFQYDASVHSFFIGYILTAIITLIEVNNRFKITDEGVFNTAEGYFWILSIAASVLLRVYADFEGLEEYRKYSAKITGVLILWFFSINIYRLIRINKNHV